MLGCVPKTKFHNFYRPNHYRAKTSYKDKTIQSDLWGKRRNIMFNFNAPDEDKNATHSGDNGGPILRSAVEDYNDWVVKHNSYEINQTNEQSLSQYTMKQLWVQKNKTKMLLLVKVDEDDDMFRGKRLKSIRYRTSNVPRFPGRNTTN